METNKIAIGCFFAGVIFVMARFVFISQPLWLALAVGLFCGCFCYGLKELPKTILGAWSKKIERARRFFEGNAKKRTSLEERDWELIKEWLMPPRPFFSLSVLIGVFLTIYLFLSWDLTLPIDFSQATMNMAWSSAFFTLILVFIIAGVFYVVKQLAFLGAVFWENCYWPGEKWGFITIWASKRRISEKCAEKPLNYQNALRWIAEGIFLVALFFVWIIWGYVARFILLVLRFVYSKNCFLCAVSGTLGGIISYYLCFTILPVSFNLHLILVLYAVAIFGGCVGMMIGVASYLYFDVGIKKA